jgi:hypothetical protein
MKAMTLFSLMMCLLFSSALTAEINDGYNAFRFVKTRNVFDPNRSAVPRERREERPSPRASRSDSLALTGTMVTAGKSLAFFGGSRAEYSKVISTGDSVGRFKLGEITSSGVTLERDGKTTTLAIGRQLTIGESGSATEEPISPPPPPESTSDAPPASADASATDAPAPPSPASATSGGAISEVMRKMMERRQKEMSK